MFTYTHACCVFLAQFNRILNERTQLSKGTRGVGRRTRQDGRFRVVAYGKKRMHGCEDLENTSLVVFALNYVRGSNYEELYVPNRIVCFPSTRERTTKMCVAPVVPGCRVLQSIS